MTSTEKTILQLIENLPPRWSLCRNDALYVERSEFCDNNESIDNLLSVSEYYGVDYRKNKVSDEIISRAESLEGYRRCHKGDLVMNYMLAWKGAQATSLYDGVVSPSYAVFRPFGPIEPMFAHYLYRTSLYCGLFETNSTGIMRSRLRLYPKSFLKLYSILPPVNEQRQIVAFLDRKCSAIDTAIEKTKESIEKLEEYKKAVITKAVTKGLDPGAKMKNSGVEWIGEVPESWDVVKTKYLFRILKRIAGKEGYDVISITQGGLKIKDIKSNEGQLAENYSNYQFVFPGDFAMNHMDLLTGWVDLSVLSGVTSPDYRVFRRIKDSTNNDYYKYLFQSLYFNKIYYGKAQGVAEVGRKRLQAPVFKEIKLPYPPAEEQTKIAKYIQVKCFSIDALITKKQEAISKWEEYKKSLIYYAVTGKIDCRNEAV